MKLAAVLFFLGAFFAILRQNGFAIETNECYHFASKMRSASVGILPRSNRLFLLVVDIDHYEPFLYELPLHMVTKDGLVISHASEFKPIQQKWPHFYESVDRQFRTANGERIHFGATTFWNAEGEYILVREADWTRNGSKEVGAVLFNMDTGSVTNRTLRLDVSHDYGEQMLLGFKHSRMVASSSPNVFYEFIDTSAVTNAFIKWQVSPDQTVLTQVSPWIHLCNVVLLNSIYFTEQPCNDSWLVTRFQNGFQHPETGKFFLFGDQEVLIVDQEAFSQLETPFSVKRVPYADWIQCTESVPGAKTKPPVSLRILVYTLTIITILLALLFFIVIGTLYFCSNRYSIGTTIVVTQADGDSN